MSVISKKIFLVLVVFSVMLTPVVYFAMQYVPEVPEQVAPVDDSSKSLDAENPVLSSGSDIPPALTNASWDFVRSEYDGTVIIPKKPGVFTLTFTPDHVVQITTDCNSMSATYALQGYSLTFGPIMSTEMYCEGSQEQEFARVLSDVHAYSIGDNGDLSLRFAKSGVATFTQKKQSAPIEMPAPVPKPVAAGCFVGGCSREVCSERSDVVSTCIWREEFACYQKATCERQSTGQCGWTETPEFKACMSTSANTDGPQVQ